jgi:hypothetical protein
MKDTDEFVKGAELHRLICPLIAIGNESESRLLARVLLNALHNEPHGKPLRFRHVSAVNGVG